MNDSFILYTKYVKQIKNLTMEQRGLLFTAILIHEAHGDDVMPELDAATSMAFDFIREDLEENARKYLDKCITNSQNGARGGRPRKQPQENKTEKTERFFGKRTQPKKADNDSDDDNDIKEKDIAEKESPAKAEPLMPAVQEIVKYLNEKAGTHYRHTSRETVDLVKARMNDHFTIDDFKRVIDVKCDEWMGTEQQKYLRPETLFKRSHFEGYLNQPVATPKVTKFDKGMMRRTGADKAENDDLVRQILARG